MIKPSQQAFEQVRATRHLEESGEPMAVNPRIEAEISRAHDIGVKHGQPDWALGSVYFTNWALIGVTGSDYIQAQLITQVTDHADRRLAISATENGLRSVLRLRVKDPFRKIASNPEIAIVFLSDTTYDVQQNGESMRVANELGSPWSELESLLDQLEQATFDDDQGIYDGDLGIVDLSQMIVSRGTLGAVSATIPAA